MKKITYIGPYVEVLSGGTYEDVKKYYGCKEHGKMSFDYCPKCGSKCIELERTETIHHDIIKLTHGRLHIPGYIETDKNIYLYNIDVYDLHIPDIFEINDTNIEQINNTLKENRIMDQLKEKGIKYKVCFGAINYTVA